MTEPRENSQADKLAAFEAVVSEYEGLLLRYSARILQDEHAAQDVVQETFLRLFRNWKEPFKPCSKMASWLYRVAHNCAVDYLRRQANREIAHVRHAQEQPEAVPPHRGGEPSISEAAEKAAQALQKLSLRERQLVILKVYEEKSYKEISEIMGLSVSNVGYLLHVAMKKLAAELKRSHALPACTGAPESEHEM